MKPILPKSGTLADSAGSTGSNRFLSGWKRASILLAFICLHCCLNCSAPGQTNSLYAWKTFTGMSGGAGNSDGPGGQARFYFPYGVAVNSAGDLYVADTYNCTIRKVTGSGLVTTVAGVAGVAGSTDGPGSAARFSSPASVAVDGAGTLYVADTYNHTIRKVATNGVVTTLAGSAGQVGSADGPGAAARFNTPYGIAVDSAGDLFVTDAGNSTLRKVTSDGVVSTLAGTVGQSGSADGPGGTAQFYYPAGVALDATGNIYIADLDNSTIRKVTGDGMVSTLAGSAEQTGSEDGTNSMARFNYPSSLTVDGAGNVFVADTYNATVRKVTSGGVVTTLAGSVEQTGSDDGTNEMARFNYPSGIAVVGSGLIYVADTDNSTIRQVTSGGVVTTLAGSLEQSGSTDADGRVARFNAPYGAALDGAGNTYVADTFNHTIRKVSGSSLVETLAGSAGQPGSADGAGDAARFDSPYGIAATSDGIVYVTDTFNHTLRQVTSAGVVTTWAGSAGQSGTADGTNGAARFASPIGLATDVAGDMYVADFFNHTLRKVTRAGVVTTLAGSAGQAGTADGTNGTARFNGPFGVATDAAGNVYVTDSASHTIRKVSAAGVVTTLAGSAGQSGSTDGTNGARFNTPAGIAADSLGNLYVADIGNATVRKVTSTGVVTTLAGSAGQMGTADGTGGLARFFAPTGVASDSAGNLRVTDSGSHTLRQVTSSGVVTTFAGGAGLSGSADIQAAAARFFGPTAVAVGGSGILYVADTYNSTIRKVSRDGAVSTLAGLAEASGSANGMADGARFAYPFGLAADPEGNVYVADSYNSTLRKVTREGTVTTLAGSAGQPGSADGQGGAARFSYPSGVALDGAGNLYVADYDNSTVRKLTPSGWVTTLAGSPGLPGSADGQGGGARFANPNGVAVDAAGNVYVADSGNATLRKVTSAGVVTTLAGSPGQPGSADGTGTDARFDYPFGVAVDGAGNIFVADAGNSTLRKVTSDGMVTTIGGLPYLFGGEDGIGSSASFAGPCGIALDANGRLYVADNGNNRISRGVPLPLLRIAAQGNDILLSWPSPAAGFALQHRSEVAGSNGWSNSTHNVSDNGTNKQVWITPGLGNQFFRLLSED